MKANTSAILSSLIGFDGVAHGLVAVIGAAAQAFGFGRGRVVAAGAVNISNCSTSPVHEPQRRWPWCVCAPRPA
jgi:hypothetical protein